MDRTARYVAYYRLPAEPDRSGIPPLDRQKRSIELCLQGLDHDLVGEFTEVMSGVEDKGVSSALELALDCCRTLGATLISALDPAVLGDRALDRARAGGIEFHLVSIEPMSEATPVPDAADFPHLPLRHIVEPAIPPSRGNKTRLPAGNRAKADRFARAILPIIEQIRASGARTLTDIADELNARQVRTARGRRWYPTTVRNILNRLPGDRPE